MRIYITKEKKQEMEKEIHDLTVEVHRLRKISSLNEMIKRKGERYQIRKYLSEAVIVEHRENGLLIIK